MLKSRFAVLAATVLLCCGSRSARADGAPDLLHQLDNAFTGVFEKVAPAVVIIDAGKKPGADDQDEGFEFYFHAPDTGEGHHSHGGNVALIHSEGSGFIVRADGYIYTNYHVIEDSQEIEVKLRDKRHFTAKLVGSDPRTDIAVLKIDAHDLPVATLTDSDAVRIGQLCFAIGVPYNLDYSFSGGYVSAKGRSNLTSTPAKPMYEDYIQTDAFINPGNSGGPLFDVDGRIIGMNTLINGIGHGLAFAIPSNMLHDVGEELIATGKVLHPWLGVRLRNLSENPSLFEHFPGLNDGVYIDTIEADAPAYKSDLRPYDVITQIDGVGVSSARDLQHEILKKKVGQTVSLSVLRGSKTLTVPVQTASLPETFPALAAAPPPSQPGSEPQLGLDVENASTGDTTQPAENGGRVVVSSVDPGGPAGKAGVQPGDLITAVDEKPVSDVGGFMSQLDNHPAGQAILLYIERHGMKTHALLAPVKSGDHKTRVHAEPKP